MCRQQSGTTPICIPKPIQYQWYGGAPVVASGKGCPTRRRRCRMPLRQTIGISLALLMASAGAMAKTVEKSTSYHPATPANPEPEKSQNRPGKARSAHRMAHSRGLVRAAFHRRGRVRPRYPSVDRAAQADGNLFNRDWGAMHRKKAAGRLAIVRRAANGSIPLRPPPRIFRCRSVPARKSPISTPGTR